MKASELKIGNYYSASIEFKGSVEAKLSFNEYREFLLTRENLLLLLHCDLVRLVEPIPLTEEWWVKFGYECVQEFVTALISKSKIPLDNNFNVLVPYIESLPIHKIQNLYFALTGEEL